MRPELKGMKAGDKRMWLRLHRKEVENFYFANGREATLKEFNMMPATLDRFFARKNEDVRINRLSENDRWVYKAAMEVHREDSRRISKLEDWRDETEPIIALGRAIVNVYGKELVEACKSRGKSLTLQRIQANIESPTIIEGEVRRDNSV